VTPGCETIRILVNETGHFGPLVNDGPASLRPKLEAQPAAMPVEATLDIHALSTAIKHGDETAFARFYELYSRRLYGLLLFLTSGQEEAAREILQVTMIKVARKFRVLTNEAELWAWLSQVARNALVDHFRKQTRQPNHAPMEFLEALSDRTGSDNQELLVWLEHGLAKLDGDERALVDAVYFERQRQQNLADQGGTTRKAVESKLARILAKLRLYILERMKDEHRIPQR
jgi:RNA polymerase sigma factor (sigma-70 family)